MTPHLPKLSWQKLTVLSVVAGVLYNSWPLGPLLNPGVARHGLASDLAAAHQPYNWVFMYGDVAAAVLMLVVCAVLASNYRSLRRSAKLVLGGIVFFCIGTTVAALCSVPCVAATHQCPSFIHSPLSIAHGVGSVGSAFGLLVAVIGLWWQRRHNVFLKLQAAVYIVGGAAAFVLLFLPGQAVMVENLFISVCSVCLAVFPWGFTYAYYLDHRIGQGS